MIKRKYHLVVSLTAFVLFAAAFTPARAADAADANERRLCDHHGPQERLCLGTLHRVDKIARFNPKTKEWLELPLPQAGTDVRRIEIDPTNPNRIFWSGVSNNARMGFIELLTN